MHRCRVPNPLIASIPSIIAVCIVLCLPAPSPAAPDKLAPIRIVSYNVRNYALRPIADPRAPRKPKGEREIAALLTILESLKPDILGLCEIGSEEDLKDLQQRLKNAGTDLPHSEYVNGVDRARHLALLSRYPIVKRDSQAELYYISDDTRLPMQRGMLDVTVQINADYHLRLLGLHLKSQRETTDAEQAMMRRQEAHLVRLRVDSILKNSPEENLLVYGDLNESRDQPGVREIKGALGSPRALRDLPLADASGEKWTYYYEPADEYSRIDFALASAGLMPEIRLKLSGIYGAEGWDVASDHRPLFIFLVPQNEPAP